MDVSGTSMAAAPATTWCLVEVPLGWTSDVIVSDDDMILKIRARHATRNRELYTGQWADTRSSRSRCSSGQGSPAGGGTLQRGTPWSKGSSSYVILDLLGA